jgi:hypothetical protein
MRRTKSKHPGTKFCALYSNAPRDKHRGSSFVFVNCSRQAATVVSRQEYSDVLTKGCNQTSFNMNTALKNTNKPSKTTADTITIRWSFVTDCSGLSDSKKHGTKFPREHHRIQLKSSSWRRWLWRNEPVESHQAVLGYRREDQGQGVAPSGWGEGGESHWWMLTYCQSCQKSPKIEGLVAPVERPLGRIWPNQARARWMGSRPRGFDWEVRPSVMKRRLSQ